ncbi:MAG: DUF4234 domain-containing protein [Clostridia bacterium]|nr:DUF4234 domain-containing protein [Clostridia bacterium]
MIKQRKIAKYVLLQIVTLGIYGLFFWSDWTEDLNKMCEDDDNESANYILVFILDIFSLGLYSFIWNYSQSERMYRIAPQYGISLKHGGSYILLLRTILFFLPVIGSVEKIKLFNTLAVAYNATLTEEEILAAQEAEKQEKEKNSKKSKKQAKKQAKAEKKAAAKAEKANKKVKEKPVKEKAEKKPIKLPKLSEKPAPVEEEKIIPTDAVTLPGLTDDTMPDITTHASAPVEEIAEEVIAEVAPVEFKAPQFETIEIPEPVKPEVEIPAVEEIVDVLVAEEAVEAPVAFDEPSFKAPEFEVIDTTPVDDFKAPEFEVIDTTPVDDFKAPEFEVVDEPAFEIVDETPAVEFTAPTFETVEEPVYEIADIEIPDLDFDNSVSFEAPVEVEEVTEIKFDEPAAYEISTDIPEISFIDDEVLTPTAKEDILKQATKTVGTKRTVKEKVAKEPAAKKSTKTAEEKATKSTKAKKDTATKSTTKKTTAKKSEPVEEIKVEDLTFGEVEFEEVDLGADILSEIAEISKK